MIYTDKRRGVVLNQDDKFIYEFICINVDEYKVMSDDIESLNKVINKERKDRVKTHYEDTIKLLDEFKSKYGINYFHIYVHGDTKIDKKDVEYLIPHIRIVDQKKCLSLKDKENPDNWTKSYKSYVHPNWETYHLRFETPYLILHEDAMSAWNGLLFKFNNPTYIMITKMPK